MPYAGDVYSLPGGTAAVSGTTANSTHVNSRFSDLETAQNAARPIVAGGTGATSAAAARTNLGVGNASAVTHASLTLDSTLPVLTLDDSNTATTHNKVAVQYNAEQFRVQLRDDAATAIASLFDADADSAGWNTLTVATDVSQVFEVGGTAQLTLSGSGAAVPSLTATGAITGAAGSFTTVSTTGNIRIDKDAPEILFNETAGSSATHQATFLIRSDNSFIIGTNDSTGTFVSSDYTITVGASGATKHGLNIEGTEVFSIEKNGLTSDIKSQQVYNNTIVSSANVAVDSGGIIRRSSSSAAFKQDPQPIENAGAIIESLNPLTFRSAIDGDDQTRRYAGFYAEEVAAAYEPAAADNGTNYDVRAIVALLCAEVKSLRARVAALESV